MKTMDAYRAWAIGVAARFQEIKKLRGTPPETSMHASCRGCHILVQNDYTGSSHVRFYVNSESNTYILVNSRGECKTLELPLKPKKVLRRWCKAAVKMERRWAKIERQMMKLFRPRSFLMPARPLVWGEEL
jgi:hypothetical protein